MDVHIGEDHLDRYSSAPRCLGDLSTIEASRGLADELELCLQHSYMASKKRCDVDYGEAIGDSSICSKLLSVIVLMELWYSGHCGNAGKKTLLARMQNLWSFSDLRSLPSYIRPHRHTLLELLVSGNLGSLYHSSWSLRRLGLLLPHKQGHDINLLPLALNTTRLHQS